MAVPFIAYGLFTTAGLIGGALLRQPEINRLKAQVKALQSQVKELQKIIEEQQRQLHELRMRYDTLNFFRIFEKQRVASDIKGQVMHLCSFKEYLSLCMKRSRKEKLPEPQEAFLLSYEKVTTGNEDKLTDEDFDQMIEYIENKYSYAIESMDVPSLEAELAALENY